MPPKNGSTNDNFAQALTEVSDRLTRLVQDEIELAKAEVIQKTTSLARGAAAVAAGAVFGVFAVVFFLLTLAWVLDGIFVSGAGSLWLGFLIVLVILLILTGLAFIFAWRKLKVGAPTPKMAIDEGKKIKDTVTSLGTGYGTRNASAYVTSDTVDAAVASSTDVHPASPPRAPATADRAPAVADAPTADGEPTFVVEPVGHAPGAVRQQGLSTGPENQN